MRPFPAAVASVLVAVAIAACNFTNPYNTTCGDINTSPDKLRETSFDLAGSDVQRKIRYDDQMERICADAPETTKPAQQVKPEE